MDQLPDPKRRKIRDVVFDILRTADLETTTEHSIRTTVAERLGFEIFGLQEKRFIRDALESFLLSTEEPPALVNGISNGASEKGTKDFLPEEQLIAEPPQQEADVSLPDGRFVDSQGNNGRVICKLSDERSVGLVDIQGNPFVSIRDFYEKDGKLVPSARGEFT
ncbi:hypothetical protein HAX54_011904 [Datura stramonium]|uniref:DEK-C domain-containing protein n=1 Tax=Datura stramonium TaxID=4076 RepID=A0ABS8TKQ9_DATST|nr:hypothetical protein [Datura stramonium]